MMKTAREMASNASTMLDAGERSALLQAYVLLRAAGIRTSGDALHRYVTARHDCGGLDALARAIGIAAIEGPRRAAAATASIPLRRQAHRARLAALGRQLAPAGHEPSGQQGLRRKGPSK